MSDILNKGVGALERGFDELGMGQGDAAPIKRAAFGLGVGYLFGYVLKPAVAWETTPDGAVERPWKFTAKKTDGVKPTYLPAWVIAIAPAVIFSVFI